MRGAAHRSNQIKLAPCSGWLLRQTREYCNNKHLILQPHEHNKDGEGNSMVSLAIELLPGEQQWLSQCAVD